MTPALQQFADRLRLLGVDANPTFAAGPPATLSIPAKHADVGPINVYDEPDELTVEIGRLHHSHFAFPSEAAKFVAEVLADRICVTVDFLGDRCMGSSYFRVDGADPGADPGAETWRNSPLGLKGGHIRSKCYLWSGPLPEIPT
jgi:hypothetical protein